MNYPTAKARQNVVNAKEAWDTLGNRLEVGNILNKAKNSYLNCTSKN